jgi:hypothetical protein
MLWAGFHKKNSDKPSITSSLPWPAPRNEHRLLANRNSRLFLKWYGDPHDPGKGAPG